MDRMKAVIAEIARKIEYLKYSLERIGFLSLAICCVVLSTPAEAIYKKQAKQMLKEDYGYYSPKRKATKLRESLEASLKNQCYMGMGWDSQGKIDKAASIDVNVFKYGDKLISINQQRIDWNDLLPNGFPRVFGEARLNKGDTYEIEVERDGGTQILNLTCNHDRAEFVKQLEIFATALDKHRGQECLELIPINYLDSFVMQLRQICAGIQMVRRKMDQRGYNEFHYQRWTSQVRLARIFYEEGYYEGISRWESLYPELQGEAAWLEQYDSFSLASALRGEIESLDQKIRRITGSYADQSQDETNAQAPTSKSSRTESQPTSTMLEICSAKTDPKEKLTCFELLAELNVSSPPSGRSSNLIAEDHVEILLLAFEDISGVVNSGVRYEDYTRAVNELSKAVSRFDRRVRKGDVNISDTNLSRIKLALRDYRNAATLWQARFGNSLAAGTGMLVAHPAVASLKSTYPSIPGQGASINIDQGLSYIWSFARRRLRALEDDIY